MERLFRWVTYGTGVILACVGLLQFDRPEWISEAWWAWASRWAVAVGAVAVLLGFIAGLATEWWVESYRSQAIKAVLEAIHEDYFDEVPARKKHLHRVTLFRLGRRASSCWFKKCLYVYSRAGKHAKSGTCLNVDGDRQNECEGVAGHIWYVETAVFRVLDHAWPADPNDIAGQEAYAKDGFLSVDKAKKLKVQSRAFAGVLVKDRRGEPWGVLLVDSDTREPIESRKTDPLEFYSDLLRKLV